MLSYTSEETIRKYFDTDETLSRIHRVLFTAGTYNVHIARK